MLLRFVVGCGVWLIVDARGCVGCLLDVCCFCFMLRCVLAFVVRCLLLMFVVMCHCVFWPVGLCGVV